MNGMKTAELITKYNADAKEKGWLEPFSGSAGAFFATAMEVGWNRVLYKDDATEIAQEHNNAPMRYTLERIKLPEPGYLLGFGGAANLDIAVANKGITGIIIGAPDQGQANMWEKMLGHLRKSETGYEFRGCLRDEIRFATPENHKSIISHWNYFFDLNEESNSFYSERLSWDGRCLSGEDYPTIHEMAKNDRIHIVRLDLLNPEACVHFHEMVTKNLDAPIVAVQASNILLHYALKGGKGYLGDDKGSFDTALETYHQNLRTLTGTEKVLAVTADIPEHYMPNEARGMRHITDDPDPSRFRPPSPVLSRAVVYSDLDALRSTHKAVLGEGRVWSNIPR